MSEIKGQILGVVLVLAIFGAIGTVLVNAFKSSADNVASKIKEDTVKTSEANTKFNNTDLSNLELLTF